MASVQPQFQFVQIASGQNTHTPAFRINGATIVALVSPGLDPVGSSAQNFTLQVGHSMGGARGANMVFATSAQFVNAMQPGFSSLAVFVTSGGFAMQIGGIVGGFDEFRVVASSAQANSVRSLTVALIKIA